MLLISGGKTVTESGIFTADIFVDGGKITEVLPHKKRAWDGDFADARGKLIISNCQWAIS
jgi:dihydroorotase-like cyclic amidohydrolase